MKSIFQTILSILARLMLWRYQPKLVAITGSVGKTSTKQAIAAVLRMKYRVGKSFENYNNEFGLPLTILGFESPRRSILGWIKVFVFSVLKLIFTNYPEILVLELGTDKPGDIGYLTGILGRVEVGVVTDIGISHLQFFSSPAELAKEKLSLIRKIKAPSQAILNFDNPKVYEGRTQTKAEVIGFGFSDSANVQASDFRLLNSENTWGSNFKVRYKGTVVPFFLPNTLGKPAVYAGLAAASTALYFGLNLVSASEALKKIEPIPGRLRMLAGIKHTMILDDTYNAAPTSVAAALEVLNEIAKGRKVAVIGDMAELGSKNESGHREIAEYIIKAQVNVVILVGQHVNFTKDELVKRRFVGQILSFPTTDKSRIPVQNAIAEGDTILVKGSQSQRMEMVVKEVMAEPLLAPKLLVRQTGKWLV